MCQHIWRSWDDSFDMYMSFLWVIFRMTLKSCDPYRDSDVRNRSTAARNVDLGTRYVTVCVVSLVARRSGGSEIMIIYMSHVNKVQPIRVKMIRIAAIRVTCTVYMIQYFHP
jgi:hypothetical protein